MYNMPFLMFVTVVILFVFMLLFMIIIFYVESEYDSVQLIFGLTDNFTGTKKIYFGNVYLGNFVYKVDKVYEVNDINPTVIILEKVLFPIGSYDTFGIEIGDENKQNINDFFIDANYNIYPNKNSGAIFMDTVNKTVDVFTFNGKVLN